VVNVDPDASGEGVETITVTQGVLTDTETIGFYVDGEHSCFLSQSINGLYNSGLSNLDAVATWENLGSSALDVTQGTAAAQPTFRTSIVGGNPVVRCDGGDRVVAAAAANWTFLHDGNGSTVEALALITSAATANGIAATSTLGATSRGFGFRTISTAQSSFLISDGTSFIINSASSNNAFTAGTFNSHLVTLDEAATPDSTQYINGGSVASASSSGPFSASAAAAPLTICDKAGGATQYLTGDLFRVIIYQSALTATQRGINKAVDEWALGGTLPVTP
jgi:hypothetical protein